MSEDFNCRGLYQSRENEMPRGDPAMSGSTSNLCRTFPISLLQDLQYGDWIIHPCSKIGLVSRRYSSLRALALII